jgi:dihydropteroate synthase
MGVLNVTQDSFSDGGKFAEVSAAIAHGYRMFDNGADIVDVGGESTRPGAVAVDVDTELAQVVPVVAALSQRGMVSIDTQKPVVMRHAIAAGAILVNDVNALRAPGAVEVCTEMGAWVCLMHMQGSPQTMQTAPQYGDVVADVRSFLEARAQACLAAGMAKNRIMIDPGFGFGKTLAHNLALLKGLAQFVATGYPVLVGVSRKSMWQHLLGRPVEARLAASLAGAMIAAEQGAAMVRVHDVQETADVLRVWEAAA